jgi:hypothetical protein
MGTSTWLLLASLLLATLLLAPAARASEGPSFQVAYGMHAAEIGVGFWGTEDGFIARGLASLLYLPDRESFGGELSIGQGAGDNTCLFLIEPFAGFDPVRGYTLGLGIPLHPYFIGVRPRLSLGTRAWQADLALAFAFLL